jgi:hypothetical protein
MIAGIGVSSWAGQPRSDTPSSAKESERGGKSATPAKPETPGRTAGDSLEGGPRADVPAVEYFDFPRRTKNEKIIHDALDKPTRVDFAETPLEQCFSELGDIYKIPIIVDKTKSREEGVALDQPITLRVAGVSLRSILKLLLEPVLMTYHIENDALKITPSEGRERMVLRVYPVGDLYREAPSNTAERHGDLEQAITKMIQPDSWERPRGRGTMVYVQGTGSLLISQTPAVHEQILELLRVLREAKKAQEAPSAPAKSVTHLPNWRLRGPKRYEAYALAGLIEIDGDQHFDRSRLHDVIKAAGGQFDNEVADDGTLFVDGQLDDRPSLSEKTKYLVVGTIPQPADIADPEQIGTALKIAGRLYDLEEAALERGVRIVSLREFLKYLGYEPSE